MSKNRNTNTIRTKDWVACIVCDTRRQFRHIGSHWSVECHSKLSNYSHITEREDMCHTLKDPKDKQSQIEELESESDSDEGLNDSVYGACIYLSEGSVHLLQIYD